MADDHGSIPINDQEISVHVRIPIEDQEIWGRRRDRLRALELVHGPQRQEEFRFRVYPLIHAIKNGHVDEFIDAFENYSTAEGVTLSNIVAIRGPSGNTLLHVAAGIENADVLRALLQVIDDEQLVSQANKRGDTALHVAARAGRIRTAELLLDRGSDVDIANAAENTALHEAVKNSHYYLTDLLLQRSSMSVNKENKESKCPLYLAVETGNLQILLRLLQAMDENEALSSGIEGLSPVHGAVMHRRLGILEEMSEKKKELFDFKDFEEDTPLYLAAYENYIEGVEFLVDKFSSSAFEHNNEGYLPIHVASKMGHLETIKELLRHWPDPEELLTLYGGENILHVAAKYGRASVVKYILGNPELEKLIDAKDVDGNTPLHVATLQWQPEVLLSLTRDNKVDLKLVNNRNLTALDIVDEQLYEIDPPLRKSLTRAILISAGAPRSKDKAIRLPKGLGPEIDLEPPDLDRLNDQAGKRMVVATLIAGTTFAAGISVPEGYNGSQPDAGITTLLSKPMYEVFVICDTVALYSSIIAVVILLWTHINDSHGVRHALRKSRLPLLIALASMSVAFMAWVNLTVSKRTWLAVVTLVIGIAALIVILVLYIVLYVPLQYNSRLVQLFADYIIKFGVSISSSVTELEVIQALSCSASAVVVPSVDDDDGDEASDDEDDGDKASVDEDDEDEAPVFSR